MARNGREAALPTNSESWSLHIGVFIALLTFRIVNAYFVQTFFQPDEYFQALEPAWQIAFGPQSNAWLTWEWREGLRTSVHPYLFAGAYKAMDWLCRLLAANDHTRANALVAAPRLLQAFWAAVMDQLTWQLAGEIHGPKHLATFAALALTVVSPWQWFCSVRTFSNSLEATLTAVSLYYFPWKWFLDQSQTKDVRKEPDQGHLKHSVQATPAGLYPALTAAAIAFYLRPTNIIIWIAISIGLLGCTHSLQKAETLIMAAAFIGTTILVGFASADRVYYGEWAFPPLRFLYFNLVQSLAVFYGTNRIDYYLTEGLPLLLTTALPFAAVGLFQSLQLSNKKSSQDHLERQTIFVFAFATMITILALSAIAHKEMRFIYPLLPILHILASKPMASFFAPFPTPRSRLRQALLVLILAANVYIASYVSMTHQRGVVDVMHYLRHRQEAWFEVASREGPGRAENSNITVGFLMPCHSTPWRSHFVYPHIDGWALTCEPPINMSIEERASYLDEADVFYADPAAWLSENMRNQKSISTATDPDIREIIEDNDFSRRKWPHYLVFFEHLQPTMETLLRESQYKECRRFFNTHWHDDRRRKGDVVIWCMRRHQP